jgi:hypothetical protein
MEILKGAVPKKVLMLDVFVENRYEINGSRKKIDFCWVAEAIYTNNTLHLTRRFT